MIRSAFAAFTLLVATRAPAVIRDERSPSWERQHGPSDISMLACSRNPHGRRVP
jgi:hypothetical protein